MQEYIFKRIDNGTYSVIDYTGDDSEVVVPKTHAGQPVTIIYDRVFRYHPEITSIILPGTLTDIGSFVFDGCDNLRYIELPDSMRYLWQHAFTRSSIEEIVLPAGIRNIASYTFKDCKKLRKVVCNPGLIEIKAWAFQGCDQLEEVIHGPDTIVSPKAFE
jgi:hypothetical protein